MLTTPPCKTSMLRNRHNAYCRAKFQSGGKLLPHSDIREGVFLGEALRGIRRDIKLGIWNVRSLYRAGSLKAAARELARYNLDVVGVVGV